MTTLVSIRDALVAHMESNWNHSDVKVIYENKTVDLDRVGDRFIRFTVDVYESTQANLAPSPFHRYYGSVEMELYTKAGSGVRATLALLDELTTTFKYQVIAGVHTETPTPSRSEEHDGWYLARFSVPFFADSNA